MKNILVIDIGGSHVKLMISRAEKKKFDSGPDVSPKQIVAEIEKRIAGWKFDAISIGFPAPVRNGEIVRDPKHLGKGWVGFQFADSLGKPVRIVNDAALQALGSYHGGRLLFLGLGTGLGSALIWERNVLSLELGDLPYPGVERIEDRLGKAGLGELGKKTWKREVLAVVAQLKLAFIADYVVLGGGNAKQFDSLPKGIVPGQNRNAFLGGRRLWQVDPRTRRPRWRVF